jgi:hypothetical protein
MEQCAEIENLGVGIADNDHQQTYKQVTYYSGHELNITT